jgi:hypothetical protein
MMPPRHPVPQPESYLGNTQVTLPALEVGGEPRLDRPGIPRRGKLAWFTLLLGGAALQRCDKGLFFQPRLGIFTNAGTAVEERPFRAAYAQKSDGL